MNEEIEDRSSEAPLDLEATQDELRRCGKSRIKYTRAVLLEFTEVEVCRKLPRDFDLLILRELDGASDGTTEHKQISPSSSLYAPPPSSRGERWDNPLLTERKQISPSSSLYAPLPSSRGERWDNPLLIASKKSYSQGNSHSDITDDVRQRLLQESGYNAGILGPKIQKSDLFRLRKSGDPYLPPHKMKKTFEHKKRTCSIKKTPQPLNASSELGKESSKSSSVSATEKVQRDSVDSVKENDNFGHEVPIADTDDSEISPVGKSEASSKNNEGSGMLSVNKEVELGTIEDNQHTFDDFWTEILEILHLDQELKLTSIPFHDDISGSEAEIHLPNEDSLRRADHSRLSENLKLVTLANRGDATDSEAEINLPDEDSLITVDDLIAPHIMATLNKDSMEANKVISNMIVKPSLYRGKENKNFLTKLVKPNIIHSTPTLNCCTSYFRHQPFLETTLTKMNIDDSLVRYSVLDQPNTCPPQQDRLLSGAKCPNPIKPSQQTICQGFMKSYAVALDPTVKGGFNDQKASVKLYTDAVLGRVRQPGRGTLPSQRPI